MEKNKGGEPLFGLFSRPERGAKGLPAWLWCAGWLARGGCGFVLVVQVGVGLWVSPFFPAPLVSRSPGGVVHHFLPCTSRSWALEKFQTNLSLGPGSGGAAHASSTCHFSHRLFGGGASPVAPPPTPVLPSHNFRHPLGASRILALCDKSHVSHSRGAHFPPGLKMRIAEGLISSR